MNNQDSIRTVDAAIETGLSRNYIALLARQGRVEGSRDGRDWFISRNSLQDFLASNRKPGPRGPRARK